MTKLDITIGYFVAKQYKKCKSLFEYFISDIN